MSSSPIYQQLSKSRREIRLLALEPGLPESEVRCLFTVVSLLDLPLPSYETISYVWGDETKRGRIFIDEHELDVPFSAEDVLRYMQYPDRQRMVWIDAVCINQRDTDERSHQVELMCDIYSSPVQGLIWLGYDRGNGEEIFKTFRSLYAEASRQTDNFREFKETVWPGWWDTYRPASAVRYDPDIMADFFDEAWFSRLWVVQEAALPPRSTCYYGSHTMPMLELLRAAIWLWSSCNTTETRLSGHKSLARAVHVASYADELFDYPFRYGNNLQWMLHTLCQYHTSRSEDNVYGLVGMYQRFVLGTKALPPGLIPDYTKSRRDIFSDAVRLSIEELQLLNPLLYVTHRSMNALENSDWPSWVPKWYRQQNLEIDSLPLNYQGFHASGKSKYRNTHPEDGDKGTLHVEGSVLDHVQYRSETFTQLLLNDPERLVHTLRCSEALLHSTQHTIEDLARTLVGSLHHRRGLIARDQSTRGYLSLLDHLRNHATIPRLGKTKEPPTIDNAESTYYEALYRWLRNRCFFVTNQGYIGIGPQVLREGDHIVMVCGAGPPMVLRERLQGSSFALVGHAYVDGVMFGEAFDAERICEQFSLD